MQLPAEIIDAITSYVTHNSISWDDEDGSRHFKITTSQFRKRLATLRLTNKAFCQIASPRLFQHVIATFQGSLHTSRLVALREISNSSYAPYVRHLDIGIDSQFPDSQSILYAEELAALLSPCLARFPNLSSLDFIYQMDHDITYKTKQILITSVIKALRHVYLPNLDELDISFPVAHDFGQFLDSMTNESDVPIHDVFRRLRHLGLHVKEWTSQQGQRYWLQSVTPENSAVPNETFAVNLFSLISLAENIQSLAISSTNMLDLDKATFPHCLRLRSLNIRCASISADTLLGLVKNCWDSMRFVQFWQVELKSETWNYVLIEMSKLPNLVGFHMESSGYSLAGTSAQLRGLLPEPDHPQAIESIDFQDFEALGILQRQVNTNRTTAGFSKASDYRTRYAREHKLADVMAAMGRGE